MKYENLVERAKNPTSDSLVGMAKGAGKKAVALGKERAELHGQKRFVSILDHIDQTAKELPEGQYRFRAALYNVQQHESVTIITKKNRSIGVISEEIAYEVYQHQHVPLWGIDVLTIERDDEGVITRILNSAVSTTSEGVEQQDFELKGLIVPDLIYPLPADDQAGRVTAIKTARTYVMSAQMAHKESLTWQPS